MKHLMDVSHKGISFLPETKQNSTQILKEIWSLEEFCVESNSI